jgi:cytochrome P450
MSDLAELIQIEDPEFYTVDNAQLLARLRSEVPVFYHEPLGCWVLSKYDDIRYVEKTPETFTTTRGTLLNSARFRGNMEKEFFDEDAELLSTLDPPRHGELRRRIAPAFTPRMIARLEDPVRATCRQLIGGLRGGEPVEFVHNIARIIPTRAVAQLLGVPSDAIDVDKLIFWADELFKVGAPLPDDELAEAARNVIALREFVLDMLERKRVEPGVDLMSVLAAAEADRAELTKANIVMLAELVLIAGIDTTRNTLSAAMWTLARHPDQLALLAANPGLTRQAVEEVLRWITPVPGFTRSTTRDTELRGQPIERGDYVYMLYFAANRDEAYWEDADSFDITRRPDPPVLSFGFGQHACIGAALARLEVRVFLEELVRNYVAVELAGRPERVPSVMQHGWAELPLVFRAR